MQDGILHNTLYFVSGLSTPFLLGLVSIKTAKWRRRRKIAGKAEENSTDYSSYSAPRID
jgi:hypothetical protein